MQGRKTFKKNPHPQHNMVESEKLGFLHLPPEIRNQIYRIILENGRCKSTSCQIKSQHFHHHPRVLNTKFVYCQSYIYSLLQVNMQIRHEFAGLFGSCLEHSFHSAQISQINHVETWLRFLLPLQVHFGIKTWFDKSGHPTTGRDPYRRFWVTLDASFDLQGFHTKVMDLSYSHSSGVTQSGRILWKNTCTRRSLYYDNTGEQDWRNLVDRSIGAMKPNNAEQRLAGVANVFVTVTQSWINAYGRGWRKALQDSRSVTAPAITRPSLLERIWEFLRNVRSPMKQGQ